MPDSDLRRANRLYKAVQGNYLKFRDGDSSLASLIIEQATDAITLFGEGNHSQKVELRKIITDATSSLPPKSVKDLVESVTRVIIAFVWPKNRALRIALSVISVLVAFTFGVPTPRDAVLTSGMLLFDQHSCYITPSGRSSARDAAPYESAGNAVFHRAEGSGDFAAFNSLMREALTQYQTAASMDPCKALYQIDVGTTYTRLTRYEEALPYLVKGVRLDPSVAWFHNELCIALKKAKRIDASVDECMKAIRKDKTYAGFDENNLLQYLNEAEKYRKQHGDSSSI